MCGIIGYLGKQKALPVLIHGLKKLEYRGYDSAGVAVFDKKSQKLTCYKSVGKINQLERKIKTKKIHGSIGIAHTRWATHGSPTITNAHPHSDCGGNIWLVHNGIIENYQNLKEYLEKKGHKFTSKTDTEVLAHLIEDFYRNNLTKAVRSALKLVKGAYGLVVMSSKEPNKLIAARMGSPLIIGIGAEDVLVTSDASAIVSRTKDVMYMEDGELAEIEEQEIEIFDAKHNKVDKKVHKIEWDIEMAEKQGFSHFMLKEIFEQSETVRNSMRGRINFKTGQVKLGGFEEVSSKLKKINKIIIVACGTARYAGLVGKYMFEEIGQITTEVDYASEFRYRNEPLRKDTAILAISQSGETADTLAAIRKAKKRGLLTLGIINVVGSSIAREVDAGVYTRSGPEIAVASTKVYTSQLIVLALMAMLLAQLRGKTIKKSRKLAQELSQLPKLVKETLKSEAQIKKIAKRYKNYINFAFMGRKYNCPTAYEGAIKLKEISYIHAEGFPSGEMKHGPISMIDREFPSVFISPQDSVYEKNLSNMEEIKARHGRIFAVATRADRKVKSVANDVVYIPKIEEMFSPILAVIPLQIFAYYIAVLNKRDVDKPRNLAKSVTVE